MNKFNAMSMIQTATFCFKHVNRDGTIDRSIRVGNTTVAVVNESPIAANIYFVHLQGRKAVGVEGLMKALSLCLDDFMFAMAESEVKEHMFSVISEDDDCYVIAMHHSRSTYKKAKGDDSDNMLFRPFGNSIFYHKNCKHTNAELLAAIARHNDELKSSVRTYRLPKGAKLTFDGAVLQADNDVYRKYEEACVKSALEPSYEVITAMDSSESSGILELAYMIKSVMSVIEVGDILHLNGGDYGLVEGGMLISTPGAVSVVLTLNSSGRTYKYDNMGRRMVGNGRAYSIDNQLDIDWKKNYEEIQKTVNL